MSWPTTAVYVWSSQKLSRLQKQRYKGFWDSGLPLLMDSPLLKTDTFVHTFFVNLQRVEWNLIPVKEVQKLYGFNNASPIANKIKGLEPVILILNYFSSLGTGCGWGDWGQWTVETGRRSRKRKEEKICVAALVDIKLPYRITNMNLA